MDKPGNKLFNSVEHSERRFLEFADLEDVPVKFLKSISEKESEKIRIWGSKIYVRGNESAVHRDGVSILKVEILRSSFAIRRNLLGAEKISVIVVNQFSCGTLVKKIPDALFESDPNEGPKASLEFAFSNESTNRLYLESVHVLTQYTTIEYAFGVKIHSNSRRIDFDALFFAMRRAPGNLHAALEDLPTELEQIYENSQEEEEPLIHFPCVAGITEEDEYPVDYVESQMDKYGVEFFFTKNINEANYNYENVTIPAFAIAGVRQYYRRWWQSRFDSQAIIPRTATGAPQNQ